MQRNFVAKYLKDDKGSGIKHAALVAFVSPNGADWRLSFVKVEYKFDDAGEPVPELSPARRYSFLIEENSHTAQSRLLSAHTNPTLGQLEEAFSVEPVTDEFFGEYRELFYRLEELLDDIVANNKDVKDDFVAKGVDTADFAKKLLGQIVFLYFLQRKGWFGVPRGKEWGEGSKNFLRELFEKEHGDYQNFFNDILEPLFYEALSRKHTDDYYSRFDCRIPFLNGGLFDPINQYSWIDVDINLSNDIFSNGDATGILDIFDHYNFTVNENEPLEREVAVDPEMLGKVFERLLPVKDRKSKGTYYTPREIVHYMCRESLANYLATELEGKVEKADIKELIKHGEDVAENESRVVRKGETKTYKYQLPDSVRDNAEFIDAKLASIYVCDPAVGSGAFLVGMMNEIVRVRNSLSPYINNGAERPPYHFKRQAIENCLYGVDIDSSATEIAKLRLWLSLVVDEEDRTVIKPLPNLDYRVAQGNSLLGMENFLCDPDKAEELKKLQRRHIRESDPDERRNLRRQIKALQYEMDSVQDSDFGVEFSFRRHFLEVFDDKDGFDVVIGNPPYGAEMTVDELKKVKENLQITKNANSAAAFIDYSINRLINDKGTLTFIVPKSILFAENWFDLVQAMLRRSPLLVDVEMAFEKVRLEQVVFMFGKSIQTNSYAASKFLNNEFVRTVHIPNELVSKYATWVCDVSKKEIDIAEKITSKPIVYMRDISQTKRGAPFQKYLKKKGDIPVIRGKNIFKYGLKGINEFLASGDISSSNQKLSFLKQPKIISQRIVAHIQKPIPHIQITATVDMKGDILNVDTVENTVLECNDYDLRYIVALLNSQFVSWFAYKFVFGSAIRTMDLDNYYVGKIPIAKISKGKQKPFIEIVDKILAITGSGDTNNAQVCEYEKEIDKLVYDLYDLTSDEIEIIKKGNNPK